MQQPLDVVGKSEVLGGLQEASADNTLSVCAILGQILLRTLRVPE